MDKIIKKIEALNKLNDQAHNPEILELIQNAEEKETDISVLQQLFATREIVWDLIDAIAEQELFIKETTHTPQKKKCCNKKKKEEACECDDKNCCCKHKHG